MVNRVTLIGNLGKDPEVRHLESGSTVARFSIATNERYKDKNGQTQTVTEWHDVVAWRRLAEIAEKFLTKGKMVYVEGKLTHRSYQDKDGIVRYVTEVVANNFQMLDRKNDSEMGEGSPAPAVAQAPETSTPAVPESPLSDDDDDLPF